MQTYKIGFIGNFLSGPGGETADETHIVRELEKLGHTVFKIPRDEWREYVIEKQPQNKYKVAENITFDIAIICKWHHFYDGTFITALKEKYQCPVFYWVWDYMDNSSVDNWHMKMAQAADLFLSGELGLANFYHTNNVKFYYFQFDSADGISRFSKEILEKKYDVIYTGSHSNQNGRIDMLREINKTIPIHVFAYDWQEWKADGFIAEESIYLEKFNEVIAQSKIILGTSGAHNCFGYWSNRIGKVLFARGFLLQQYTPGMETLLGDTIEYFSSAQEAIDKIQYFLENPSAREEIIYRNLRNDPTQYTSAEKVKQLSILIERYKKENNGKEWLLP